MKKVFVASLMGLVASSIAMANPAPSKLGGSVFNVINMSSSSFEVRDLTADQNALVSEYTKAKVVDVDNRNFSVVDMGDYGARLCNITFSAAGQPKATAVASTGAKKIVCLMKQVNSAAYSILVI